MISETVNIPTKTDFSLFQRGAETTPGRENQLLLWARGDIACMPTVKEQALESFLDLQLGIEDDETKADGECIVGCATSEESAD
jgi:hypothetical protein